MCMQIFSFFHDHFITSAPSRLRADKVEADKKRRRKRERAGGRWVRENIKRTDRREGQIESWEQRMEMGRRNNAGRMMGSSYSRSRGSGLTFSGRQRAGGDKHARMDIEAARTSKSTEKYESTSAHKARSGFPISPK